MSDINKCQELLIELAEEQGYLTFDDIMDASDSFSLSVQDVDVLSEAIQIRGIIVYEEAPPEFVDIEETDYDDFSKIDYDEVFKIVENEAEELIPFIEQIRSIVPPQYGELSILTQQAANGNSFARERLILSHARIAIKIALSLAKQRGLDLGDAVSAAMMGLIVGTDKFSPNGFSTFQGYVSLWVQRYVQRYCKPVWIDYYFPSHVLEKMIPVFKMYLSERDYHFEDDVEIIFWVARKSDLYFGEAAQLIDYAKTQAYGKISYEELKETAIFVNDSTMMAGIIENDLKNSLHSVLSTLTLKEQKILKLRFGLDGGEVMTLEEIGAVFGVSRERIRQIEAKALRKLRHPSRSKRLKDYLY